MVELREDASLPPLEAQGLRRILSRQGLLTDVVSWMAADPQLELIMVIDQDEFCNDVVLRWRESKFLVYECT